MSRRGRNKAHGTGEIWRSIYISCRENRRWWAVGTIERPPYDSPMRGHVNMLGHYSFILAENVMKGKLRPLNQPSEQIWIP